MSGDKLPPKPHDCPGCGAEPQRGSSAIGKTFRHCEAPNCVWARCPICTTVWDLYTGRNFNE